MSVRAYLGLGSNVEPQFHLRRALDALRERFGPLAVSPIYRTPAEGFVGDDFLNLVVGVETTESPAAVVSALRGIEDALGRRRDGPKFGPRNIDIDLLTHGATVSPEPPLPREDITRYAFVLGPLADIAGTERHPVLGLTYAELWQAHRAAHPGLTLTRYAETLQ